MEEHVDTLPPDPPAAAELEPPPELPEYEFKRHVRALKIKSVASSALVDPLQRDQGAAALVFEDGRFAPRLVSQAYMQDAPEAGGYYIVDADGSELYCEAELFEASYTQVK